MRDLSIYAKDAANAVDMKTVLETYGIEVNRAGYALCPFHTEKTGSLKVYPHSFYCYGCGTGGDAITLVQKLYDLPFSDALKKINEDFGLGLPIGEKPTLRQKREIQQKRRELERAREERQMTSAAYDGYLDLLIERERLQSTIEHLKPKPGDETLHPVYVDAMRRLPFVDHVLDNYDFNKAVKL